MKTLVEYVNNGDFTWNAKMHDRYQGLSLAEVKSRIKNGGPSESSSFKKGNKGHGFTLA